MVFRSTEMLIRMLFINELTATAPIYKYVDDNTLLIFRCVTKVTLHTFRNRSICLIGALIRMTRKSASSSRPLATAFRQAHYFNSQPTTSLTRTRALFRASDFGRHTARACASAAKCRNNFKSQDPSYQESGDEEFGNSHLTTRDTRHESRCAEHTRLQPSCVHEQQSSRSGDVHECNVRLNGQTSHPQRLQRRSNW